MRRWNNDMCKLADKMNYADFIKSKLVSIRPVGFDLLPDDLHRKLFDFQRHIVLWTARQGRAAIFAECGLGKTLMQLEWATIISRQTKKPVLIVAPLAVSEQTQTEAARFGFDISRLDDDSEAQTPIVITNYEKLHKLNLSQFSGVVLDESSILKNYSGKIRNAIIDGFAHTPYKLACTATPAPNDHMELGNHSEFLGIKSRTEMLAEYFVHDGGETQKWRLKRHAVGKFWEWVRQWAVIVSSPKDLGFDDKGFDLPKMTVERLMVESDHYGTEQTTLFPMMANSLTERRQARKGSIEDRVKLVADLVAAEPNRPWLIWCNLNDESRHLAKSLPGSIEITGSHTLEQKRDKLNAFVNKPNQTIISKPSISGFGMNWQHCSRMVFCGLSDSFEEYYQAIRRCYRFGQKEEVKVYIVISDAEQNVYRNVIRKQDEFTEMRNNGIYT